MNNILNKREIQLSSDEIDKIIYRSRFNLNTLNSNLDYSVENIEIKNDNFDTIETLETNIITKNHNLEELIRFCETNENIISLNLLENYDKIMDKNNFFKNLAYIYESYVYSDIFDSFSVMHHDYVFKKYITCISIYNFYIHKKQNITDINIIYNKYISRSILIINIMNHSKNKTELIYKYLYLIYKCNYDKEYYREEIKNMNCRNLKNIILLFDKFENYKINSKDFQ
jgi:hypothetical protein